MVWYNIISLGRYFYFFRNVRFGVSYCSRRRSRRNDESDDRGHSCKHHNYRCSEVALSPWVVLGWHAGDSVVLLDSSMPLVVRSTELLSYMYLALPFSNDHSTVRVAPCSAPHCTSWNIWLYDLLNLSYVQDLVCYVQSLVCVMCSI